MFDLHNFSFALSLSHIWVTNLYPQHGDTTTETQKTTNSTFTALKTSKLAEIYVNNAGKSMQVETAAVYVWLFSEYTGTQLTLFLGNNLTGIILMIYDRQLAVVALYKCH
jgi:hypothetical protein